MLVSDSEPEVTMTCGLKPAEALNLLQPLHARLDEEIKSGKYLIIDKHLADCETNCHCGVYSDIARNKQLKDDLYKKASKFPRKQLNECAKRTSQWICKDSLLDALRKEVEPAPDAL
jgi:predicted anti-sigma-YlaC factor YlaD